MMRNQWSVSRTLRDLCLAGTCILSLFGLVVLIPKLNGLKLYAVTSGSMAPAIPAGSLILVDPAQKTPHVGEIMTYRMKGSAAGMTVTHRVHEIRPDGRLLMKGDANAQPDLNVISRDALEGTVVSAIPRMGFLQEKSGIRMGLSALTVLCLCGWLALDPENHRKGEMK